MWIVYSSIMLGQCECHAWIFVNIRGYMAIAAIQLDLSRDNLTSAAQIPLSVCLEWQSCAGSMVEPRRSAWVQAVALSQI